MTASRPLVVGALLDRIQDFESHCGSESSEYSSLGNVEDAWQDVEDETALAADDSAAARIADADGRVLAGSHSLQGVRPTQEDRVSLVADLSSAAPQGRGEACRGVTYAAIFDGHEGEACASILQTELHAQLATRTDLAASPVEACVGAFVDVDAICCARLRAARDASGAVAIVALLLPDRTLVVAHAGDCRAVLCAAGTAVSLTADHRLARADERERVLSAGGHVSNDRLEGTLAISRAFGDAAFKHAPSGSPDAPPPPPPTVTAQPDVAVRALSCEDRFLVLGSDGLWDVLEPQSAVDLAAARLEASNDPRHAAAALTAEAVRRGSRDNISVVVIVLNAEQGSNRGASSPVTTT